MQELLRAAQIKEDLEEYEKKKKLDDFDTILAVLDGKVRTEGRHYEGKQEVQDDLLIDEGDYRLFYITIYNPNPEYTDVEAYVLFNKKTNKVSYYDHVSNNIYVDDKFIGTSSDTDLLDDVVDEYKMESKVSYSHWCYHSILQCSKRNVICKKCLHLDKSDV